MKKAQFLTEGSIIVLPRSSQKYRVEHREWFMYQNTMLSGWCIVPLEVDAPIPMTVDILNTCTILDLKNSQPVTQYLQSTIVPSIQRWW